MTGLFNTRQPGFRFSRLPCVIKVAACLLVLVGVSACEGDPELFEEGVLSNQLQIRTLSISAQGEGAAPLAINPGRQLNFVVSGTNTTGEAIELASSGRRWVSSNPAAGSISDSGRFVALENGVTDVSVLIAGIESARFRVQVSAANLVGVSEIIGPAQVSSCSRPEYTARGSFDDSSTRFIRNITWNIDAPSNDGRNNFDTDIHLNGPERALVNARGPQTVTLIASQDGYSRSFEVEIVDDLGSLRIEGVPNELAHGQTVSLRALAGSEADPEAEQQRRDVTDIAFWQVTAAEVIATVTNDNVAGDDSGGGRITGRLGGSGLVEVYCGNQSASVPLLVADIRYNSFRVTPSGDQTIALGRSVTFTASAVPDGDNEAEDVTDDRTTWIISDDEILEIDVRDDEVVVSGRRRGQATLTVRFREEVINIDITVE